MTRKEAIIEDLLETLKIMLDVIEDQNSIDPDFALVHEMAEQLRDEIAALQE